MLQLLFTVNFSVCATMRSMNLGSSIGVRLDPELRRKLEEINNATGISMGNLIRSALESYVNRVISEGKVVIPLKTKDDSYGAAPRKHAGLLVAEQGQEYDAGRGKKK